MLPGSSVTGPLADEIPDRSLEILRRARLWEHRITTGATGAPRIRRERGVPGDRNYRNVTGARILSEPTSQFEPVDPRDVKVGHDHVRAGIECPFERLQPVVSLIDAEPGVRQPVCIHTATILVIFDEEHDWRRFPRLHLVSGHQVYGGPVG